MTRLQQLQQAGIKRLGSPARGFRYTHADGKRVKAADRERIESLKIPPSSWVEQGTLENSITCGGGGGCILASVDTTGDSWSVTSTGLVL